MESAKDRTSSSIESGVASLHRLIHSCWNEKSLTEEMINVASAEGNGSEGAGVTTGESGPKAESGKPDGVAVTDSYWEETGGNAGSDPAVERDEERGCASPSRVGVVPREKEETNKNWHGLGESDCLIKTKHCNGRRTVLTQCDFCPVL
ncbi:hypothetical protein TNCT_318911 [Trichonephila clavata]|uniref:Uncharacterized protein n=1 Tax=Trichonephila clavata TaxID=2740835 RepID=A0A8X6GQL5_TRICU|nr:hypothetical protein TNCT_318911 [Trichonephila clavata]